MQTCTLQQVCTGSINTDCVNTALSHCTMFRQPEVDAHLYTNKPMKGFTLLKLIELEFSCLSSVCCTYSFLFIILFLKSLPCCRYDCRYKTNTHTVIVMFSFCHWLSVTMALPCQRRAVQPWHAVLTLILKARLCFRQVFDVRGA